MFNVQMWSFLNSEHWDLTTSRRALLHPGAPRPVVHLAEAAGCPVWRHYITRDMYQHGMRTHSSPVSLPGEREGER